MSALSVNPPFPIFLDIDGQPLDAGYIYLGVANQATEANPIQAYWDAALSVPATQPILTKAGFPVNAGVPARVYVNSDYSIVVKNRNGFQVFSSPIATDRFNDAVVNIDSSDITFLQAGTGAVARTAQAKMRDVVSVKDFGAVGDGVTDDTAEIQAAVTYAINSNLKAVYIPSGVYVVSATINLGRMCLRGDGDGSRIKPTISDGSAVLSFAAGSNFFSLDSFRIDNDLNLANFISGAINAQNCTGVKVNSSGGTFSARYVMRDVVVRGCKVGYDINGFIGTLDNVWSLACETGLIATAFNSVRAHLRFEECRKDFTLTSSGGVHFDQLISEGGTLQSGLLTSTVDGCNAITFTSMYLEQTRNVPFITFGGTTECKNVEVGTVTAGMADNAGKNNEIYALAFDRVDGLKIGGFYSTGTNQKRYSSTANTKNIVDTSTAFSAANWPNDNSNNLSVVRNYFPNPNFDLWFRGYPAVTVVRGVMTQETAITRRGPNAIKFQINAAQANGAVQFVFNDSYLGVKLRGKTVTLYAWVWVPNLSEFNPANRSTMAGVAVALFSDGTGGTTAVSATNSVNRNAWNLLKVNYTVPSDATRIDTFAYIYGGSGSSTGNEFIVVDSMYLIEGNGQDASVLNGYIVDSELNQCANFGGRMVMRSDSAPTDPDQTFEVGDQVWKFTVAAGGSPGWVCTTGGAGGTAVFKAMANVAA
jgi:hypothetical protein